MFGAGYLLEMLRSGAGNESPKKRERSRGKLGNSQKLASSTEDIPSENTPNVLQTPSEPSVITEATCSMDHQDRLSSDQKDPPPDHIIDKPDQSSSDQLQQPIIDQSISPLIGKPDKSDHLIIDPSDQPITNRPGFHLNFKTAPRLLVREWTAFDGSSSKSRFTNNFLKGCKWSPDGSCILTNSEDRKLRVFTLPPSFYEGKFFDVATSDDGQSLNQLSSMAAGELIYDYWWYPLMNSSSLESCVYVQSSCDHPIQLCDALSGQLCASYLPINHLDEVTCAYSLAFSPDGSRLYSGFNKAIRIFDTYRPGRQISTKPTFKKRQGGQSGIISCIAISPTMPSLFACGSYARSVATYSDSFDDGPMETMQSENMGGVTHLVYHPNGNHLFSGGRMDPKIVCWDMRVPGQIYAAYERDAGTNQRFYFDLDPSGVHLVSGNSTGEVKVWDTSTQPNADGFVDPIATFRAHHSATNGISINPHLPILATASGQRLFSSDYEKNEDSEADDQGEIIDARSSLDNSVKLWLVGEMLA